MLRAAATLVGLFLVWLLLTERGLGLWDIAAAGVAAVSALALGARFGGGVSPLAARAPRAAVFAVSRFGAVLGGCASTLRGALAADISLAPALARLKTRTTDPETRAALAVAISAAPGTMVVDADADGLLLHLINEDAASVAELGELEARISDAQGARGAL